MISAITVTYNNEKTIVDFLKSLIPSMPKNGEIIIVDNNSQDKTVPLIHNIKNDQKNKLVNIKLIENATNLGYSKANNLGAKLAINPYLLFINPDTVVLDNAIDKLLKFYIQQKEVSIVAPMLVREDGLRQPSVRKLPTLKGAIKEYWFGKKNEYNEFIPSGKVPVSVESAYGACLLVSKEVFKRLNGFDEKYFLYYEDLDLFRRAKKMGLKTCYLPGVKIKHVLGASLKAGENLSLGIRTLAQFFPVKPSGALYYAIKGSNIYHGWIKSMLIRIVIYLALKLNLK